MACASQGEPAARCAVILDCDGTLMDTIDAWHAAENKVMAQANIALTKAQRDELNTLTLDEAGAFFHERFGLLKSAQQVCELIFDHMLEYYRTCAVLNKGVRVFVDELVQAGVPVAILSSSPQDFLQAGLERVGMLDSFDKVVSVDDVGTTKRDVETYLSLCAQLGAEPAQTWFFDDSWYALKAARAAGLHTIGVFSKDECGTRAELAHFSEHVIDDFTGVHFAQDTVLVGA